MYYEQSGPIYGEASAPVRWEDTLAPWLEEQGFVRGANEKSVFYHPTRDILILTYVDDVMAQGDSEDIDWIFNLMDTRFECKDYEEVKSGETIDYLGMQVAIDGDRIYLSMEKYIENACQSLGITEGKGPAIPISDPIDTDSPPLEKSGIKQFLTAVGMLGWLNSTTRPDISYAYSRIAQHSAHPTEASLQAVRKCFKYLLSHKDYTLSTQIYEDDKSIDQLLNTEPTIDTTWRFQTDSDHAGNAEVQNKRRSQNGMIVLCNHGMVRWASKASSVAFAAEAIGEAHADTSSGAAEIYAAGKYFMGRV